MKHKLTKDNIITYCNDRNLAFYLNKGWQLIEKEQPKIEKDITYEKLSKKQLQVLCEEKGIDIEDTDGKKLKKEILVAKLSYVSKKLNPKPSISNKEFKDSLIIED